MHRRQHGSALHRPELLERVPGRNGTGVWETGRQESACVGRCAELHCGRAEQPGPHSESPTTLTRTPKLVETSSTATRREVFMEGARDDMTASGGRRQTVRE